MAVAKSTTCMCAVGNDIVKQGYLFVKRPPRRYWNKWRAWHKRFIVLRDETRDRAPLLEMFDSHETVCNTKVCQNPPQTSIDLGHVVHIGFSTDSTRHPHALLVVCHGRSPLLLAADDELSAKSWHLALGVMARKGSEHAWRMNYSGRSYEFNCSSTYAHCCGDNSLQQDSGILHDASFENGLYSIEDTDAFEASPASQVVRERFPVMVQPTEDAERAGLRDDVQLVIYSHGVGLAKPGDQDCFLYWPVSVIRQYKHEAVNRGSRQRITLITLEVGRRCSTGEGTYQFRTQQGQDIIQEIRRMVSSWSNKKIGTGHFCRAADQHRHCCSSHQSPWVRCSRGNTPCRSAPQTPSFLTSRYISLTHRNSSNSEKRQSPDADDINYIIPIFDRSCDSAEEEVIFSPRARKVSNYTLSDKKKCSKITEKQKKPDTNCAGQSEVDAPVDGKKKVEEELERDYLEVLPS